MHPSSPDIQTADLAICTELMRGGSRTFHAASHLLPGRVRRPAVGLYAFCRLADDAVDRSAHPHIELQEITQRLMAAAAGRPNPHSADRALAAVLASHEIPADLPLLLLEGFEWDASGRQYETIDDLLDYAARVAGTVGVMMALVMNQRTPAQLTGAAELGIAMQLTNIARDVGEDARAGRLYLPHAWLRAAQIDPAAWLARPQFTPAIADVVGRLLDHADELYRRADAAVAGLPADCRPAIRAARLIYAEIGAEVRRNGCNSLDRRAMLAPARKGVLAIQALAGVLRQSQTATGTAPVAALSLAAKVPAMKVGRARGLPWWAVAQRVVRMLELLVEFDRRRRYLAMDG